MSKYDDYAVSSMQIVTGDGSVTEVPKNHHACLIAVDSAPDTIRIDFQAHLVEMTLLKLCALHGNAMHHLPAKALDRRQMHDELSTHLNWSGVNVPNFDRQLNLRSAITAVVSFVMIAGAAFGQADTGEPGATDAANKSKATQQPDQQFQELLDYAIDVTSKRYLVANSHSPWQIFHYILAMRQESVLRLGNEKVNAIQWLSTTEPQFDKQPWLLLTPHGAKFHPYTQKFYFEGHPSQFLALLSHSNLPMDYPFHVQGKIVTLKDLVNNTMKEVNTKEEVTWVLWALQHFLSSDATWYNQANEPWSIERLVQIESAAPVVGAPCGGNHRLFALTRARDKYLQSGGTLRGVWFQADQKIKQHIEIARSLQNPDGSFSSEWYKGPGQTTDVNLRFNTTGHTMEFLAVSLPKERLTEQWVRQAVWMLSRELIINQNVQIDCGPLFHSLDALILYRDRTRAKAPSIPKTPEVASNRPNIALNPDLKLQSEPMPVQESKQAPQTKSTVKPPELAELPNDARPVDPQTVEPKRSESKPVEAKPLDSKSTDSKLSRPTTQTVPVPNLERSPATQLKPPEIKPDALKNTDSKAAPINTDTTAKPDELKRLLLAKIDPAKLANVGQFAPTSKTIVRHEDSPLVSEKQAALPGAPALLPEDSATPIDESESPSGAAKSPSCSDPKQNDVQEPGNAVIDQSQVPRDAEKMADAEADEPASALEVANP